MAQNPKMAHAINIERFRMSVSAELFEARTKAGLTQKQLADRAGMRQSAVARLEDADYAGHSLTSLWRIASALNKRVEVRLVDAVPQSLNARYADCTIEYDQVCASGWKPQFVEDGLKFLHAQLLGV
jgi:transcriptional regulator with XRE-family HTH domain